MFRRFSSAEKGKVLVISDAIDASYYRCDSRSSEKHPSRCWTVTDYIITRFMNYRHYGFLRRNL